MSECKRERERERERESERERDSNSLVKEERKMILVDRKKCRGKCIY